MPEYFRSTAKKPASTKVRKGYKKGGGIAKRGLGKAFRGGGLV